MLTFFLTLAVEIVLLAALFVGMLALAGLLPGVKRLRLSQSDRAVQAVPAPVISLEDSRGDGSAPASPEPQHHYEPESVPTSEP